ncbi:ATP-dependent RNA helicase MRH4 [Kluyveromyces marxianus DMKU3-1042]|uniref:RNA helicase n=1 Tax=Kluyveromyces marxianus (strain DMKU3-1042 / BCC 29191 / NBRC 104275) TaxID=1003335 RepID=W0TC12_KLUMD|nr:ATP-dependent RNA helicase MRH4 [Kluyveromyces marxianus DMKU3-1042]BAO40568.1 ATP-dependent RNA helicase MRH4 [Kluyveromyces marxianus DMKU3-1042]
MNNPYARIFNVSRSFGRVLITRSYVASKSSTSGTKWSPVHNRKDKKNTPKKNAVHGQPKNEKKQRFEFGEYGKLSDGDANVLERSQKLVSKITDFDSLKLLPDVREKMIDIISSESLLNKNIQNIGYNPEDKSVQEFKKTVKPSPIQTTAIYQLSKTLMKPELQVRLIAAETGSGKTMAYLIPLVDYLKRTELENPTVWESMKNKAIVRSIILLPTHELVEQVYQTVSKLEPALGMNTYKWDAGSSYKGFVDALKGRIDIMVTTPGKILSLFKISMVSRPDRILSQVKFLVMDEADTLLDKSWVEDSYSTIKHMQNLNHVLFCSATIPKEFQKTITRLFPDVGVIASPNLHKINHKNDIKLINADMAPYKGSKIKALAQILYSINRDNIDPGFEKRAVVFVNEKTSVPIVAAKLANQYGHDVVALTGSDTVEERLEKIKPFMDPAKKINKSPSKPVADSNKVLRKIPNSNIVIEEAPDKAEEATAESTLKVLVTTDVLARGINFRSCRYVVLYDIPNTSVDLVHRIGRTGRMKQKGSVFIITGKRVKNWVKAIPSIVSKKVTIS